MAKKPTTAKKSKAPKEEKARPIFWVSGNYYDSRKQWEAIKSLLGPNVNIQDLECGALSDQCPKALQPAQMSDVVMTLKSDDLFDSNSRLIRVYGCPPDYTILSDYLDYIDDRNVVVIYGPIGYSVAAGASSRFVSAKTSNLYKQINEWKGVFEFPVEVSSHEEAMSWVRQVASELGKPIDVDAANLLVMNKGRNLDILHCELVKLLSYSEGKSIGITDVESCSIPEFLKTVWDFIDSLDMRQYDKAMQHLQQFYAHAEALTISDFHVEITNLMGALEHHFTFLALVKPASHSFNGAYAALCGSKDGEFRGFKKKEKTDDGWKYNKDAYDYGYLKMNFSKANVQSALKWDQSKIWEILLDIYRCSHLCRTKSDINAKKQALDSLVMHICGILSLESARRVRVRTL